MFSVLTSVFLIAIDFDVSCILLTSILLASILLASILLAGVLLTSVFSLNVAGARVARLLRGLSSFASL